MKFILVYKLCIFNCIFKRYSWLERGVSVGPEETSALRNPTKVFLCNRFSLVSLFILLAQIATFRHAIVTDPLFVFLTQLKCHNSPVLVAWQQCCEESYQKVKNCMHILIITFNVDYLALSFPYSSSKFTSSIFSFFVKPFIIFPQNFSSS